MIANIKESGSVPCYKEDLVERLQATLPAPPMLQEMAHLFSLLGDPTRLRMLSALSRGDELCVCDVANVAGLSMSATSHQLKKLRDSGIVSCRSDGRMAYYKLRDGFAAGLLAQVRLQFETRDGSKTAQV